MGEHPGTRLLVAVYDTVLVDEIHPTLDAASRAWDRWARARFDAGLPMGGACLQRADVPDPFAHLPRRTGPASDPIAEAPACESSVAERLVGGGIYVED